MTEYRATPVTDPAFNLAEGILWDDRAQRVRWVDIWAGRVLSGELGPEQLTIVNDLRLPQTTGAVALAEDDGLLVAGARGLATITASGVVSFGPDLLGGRTDLRLNDGSVDPQGRFVVGTLALGKAKHTETLLRVSPDGTVEVIREGLGLSNGIAFSPDGLTIYHVDTVAGTVSQHSYGPGTFESGEPWTTVLSDFPAHPDGLAIDSAGGLWVAQWGGSRVCRYSPSGELTDTVVVDASQVTCPAFVGPNLDIMAITTAREGMTDPTDGSGAIFVADVGSVGLPAFRWGGSTTTPYWLTE
jgi:sugar lactone lactonase YvrE